MGLPTQFNAVAGPLQPCPPLEHQGILKHVVRHQNQILHELNDES